MVNTLHTISVVGLGYVGLPTAALIAKQGVDVIGVDINAEKVEQINLCKIPIVETGLEILVNSAIGLGKLKAVTIPEKSDAFIIAVPTPFKKNHIPDISYLKAAARSIAPVLEKGNLVLLESTSPVGTTEKLVSWLAEERPDLSFPTTGSNTKPDINIAYSPERVLPGQVLNELVNNDRIVGGITSACGQRAAEFYRLFIKGECLMTEARTAELAKLTENAYRDVNIAFANEISLVCDKLDINVWEILDLANRHPRVDILKPGPGVGGHCIAVDPWFIVNSAPDHTPLIHSARKVNDKKPIAIVDKVLNAAKELNAKSIACLGLAYKADIDDFRESPSVTVVTILKEKFKGEILIAEPYIKVLPKDLSENRHVKLKSVQECISSAKVIVLLTDHQEFKEIKPELLLNKHFIDTRGMWNNQSF